MSRFYDTDPDDPEAPQELAEYTGPNHGTIRPGDRVVYENPEFRLEDGTYLTGGMDGTYTVAEIIDLGEGMVQAILDDGTWEVNPDNLRALRP